jgi:uncharacterized coiled-coil protein SlyX
MQVFISWSGERSKLLAEVLEKWLRVVLQNVRPWMSKHSIERGKLWVRELTVALEAIDVGIICITRENKEKPWILFEAGALAKKGESRVTPYLLDEGPEDLPAPLQMFDAVRAKKEGTLLMLQSINVALGEHGLRDDDLKTVFEKWWPDLEVELTKIPESPVKPPPPPSTDESLARLNVRFAQLARTMDNISKTLAEQRTVAATPQKFQVRADGTRVFNEEVVDKASRTTKELNEIAAGYYYKSPEPLVAIDPNSRSVGAAG